MSIGQWTTFSWQRWRWWRLMLQHHTVVNGQAHRTWRTDIMVDINSGCERPLQWKRGFIEGWRPNCQLAVHLWLFLGMHRRFGSSFGSAEYRPFLLQFGSAETAESTSNFITNSFWTEDLGNRHSTNWVNVCRNTSHYAKLYLQLSSMKNLKGVT